MEVIMKFSRLFLMLLLALGLATQKASHVHAMQQLRQQPEDRCLICKQSFARAPAPLAPVATCGHLIKIHKRCLDDAPSAMICPTCGTSLPTTCCICLQDFACKRTPRATALLCVHNLCFHAECLGQWFKGRLSTGHPLTCPVCIYEHNPDAACCVPVACGRTLREILDENPNATAPNTPEQPREVHIIVSKEACCLCLTCFSVLIFAVQKAHQKIN
jgi:hypothetical protein